MTITCLFHGFWKPDTSTAGGNYGCSTVAVISPDGAPLFGRNFDWEECDKMLVHTVPKNGYASIATCNLDLVYDQRELTVALYDTEDWAHPYVLSLGQKDWCKKGE